MKPINTLRRRQSLDRGLMRSRNLRRSTRGASCLAALAVLAAGCGGDEPASARPESVADLGQWVDAQSTVQFRAIQDATARCMAAAGFDYQQPATPPAGELTGFGQVHVVSNQIRNPSPATDGAAGTGTVPPGYAEALGDEDGSGCAAQGLQQAEGNSSLEAVFAALEQQPPIEQDPGYPKAADAWKQCMTEAGYPDLVDPSDVQTPVDAFAAAQFVERGLVDGDGDWYEAAIAAPADVRTQVADEVEKFETDFDAANTKCSDESGITKLTNDFIAAALSGVPAEVFEIATPGATTTGDL